MKWTVSIPCWGERCLSTFEKATLPALLVALKEIEGPVRLLVHTDDEDRVMAALAKSFSWAEADIRSVPAGARIHDRMSECHREAIREAEPGEAVAFVNADMVCSREVFSAAEKRFAEGKRLIIMAATRTIGALPKAGMFSEELLRWTMQHPHPSIRECVWGSGRTKVPWAIYFRHNDSIVLHGFHLHPFAVLVGDKPLKFTTSIDRDLPDNFRYEDIHVVTDCNEASFAECSPPERVFGTWPHSITVSSVVEYAQRQASAHHRWLFKHEIRIQGEGEVAEAAMAAETILEKLGCPSSLP